MLVDQIVRKLPFWAIVNVITSNLQIYSLPFVPSPCPLISNVVILCFAWMNLGCNTLQMTILIPPWESSYSWSASFLSLLECSFSNPASHVGHCLTGFSILFHFQCCYHSHRCQNLPNTVSHLVIDDSEDATHSSSTRILECVWRLHDSRTMIILQVLDLPLADFQTFYCVFLLSILWNWNGHCVAINLYD